MFKPVIGLEIHIQAKTKSKMFCSCDAQYFGAEPNSHVCPVCLGLPGALPVPNKAAIDHCIRLGMALNCEINTESKFDRKNYFYPDLPKAYQISQYDLPFGKQGYLEIDVEGDSRRIRIRRVHMEEDTGKSSHDEEGAGTNETHLDFNKSGVPLIEVVTEPDFEEIKEVTAFAKLLKQTVQYTGVSDAEMQKGQMRFELNISVQTEADNGKLPDYKVEIKNIGSISVLEKIIQFEIKRQSDLLSKGEKPINETRGIRDMTGATVSQRTKETEGDYRYFPEPDIPPIHISAEHLAEIKSQLPELPAARRDRYVHDWGLELEQAEILVEQREKGNWIDGLQSLISDKKQIKEAVKWFTGDISGMAEKKGVAIADLPITPEDLTFIITALADNKISGAIVKKVLEEMFEKGGRAADIVKSQGLEQITDESAINKIVEEVIASNQKLVESLAKNPNAINALVGQVMKATRGQANPKVAEAKLREALSL